MPPTHAPPLEDFHSRISRYWTVNWSYIAQTTSSQQLFTWFLKCWWGANSWQWTKNAVKWGYVWWENLFILCSYVFGLSFVLLTAYEGRKMNNHVWLRMAGELLSIFFIRIRLFGLFFSWLSISGQFFSEIWIRMVGEVLYILYSCVFGLYIFSLTAMNTDQYHRCHQNNSFCLFYYIWIHIFKICTFWTKIQGCHLTRSVLCNLIIFHFFSYVDIVHLLQRWEDVGICCNHTQTGFPWFIRVENVLE